MSRDQGIDQSVMSIQSLPDTNRATFLMTSHVSSALWTLSILKEVTSEKCNSIELNTFSTNLSSLLGVIAIVFSNHAQK